MRNTDRVSMPIVAGVVAFLTFELACLAFRLRAFDSIRFQLD